jgi:hypothetical protein
MHRFYVGGLDDETWEKPAVTLFEVADAGAAAHPRQGTVDIHSGMIGALA